MSNKDESHTFRMSKEYMKELLKDINELKGEYILRGVYIEDFYTKLLEYTIDRGY